MYVQRGGGSPDTAVVVGAGIVGLSTAWFLQERGVDVTVVDRHEVTSGSSWGNAGWLSPSLAIPLNEPSVIGYGLRSLLDKQAPLQVPPTPNPRLLSFLARFAAHCTWRSWGRAVRANLPLNAECLDAYDELTANGVRAPTNSAPVTAGFENREQAAGLVGELERMREAGQHVDYAELTGDEARQLSPQVSAKIAAAVRLDGQRYVDPGGFVRALARSVAVRGGTIRAGFPVEGIHAREDGGATVTSRSGEPVAADAVVLATGAWLGELARESGVRVPVRAGRGYSFTVPTEHEVPGPIYLPTARVACTPYHGGLRVAGTMEFRGADAPLDRSRVEAVVASVRELLTGVAWGERTDVWVGPRPVSADGRPLIGATKQPGVFVAGGHGMWGLAHGPITGRLLAERIATGKQPEALREFDPTR